MAEVTYVRCHYSNQIGHSNYMQSILFPTALFPSLLWFAYLLLYDNRALPLGSGLLVCPQVSCRGTRMIIDSTWNLVSTHLSGKTKTSSHTAHSSGYNVIQIRICGGIQFKRSKTNIIQRFIVERKHFIGGLNQLVNS